jgi:hypothetical protein
VVEAITGIISSGTLMPAMPRGKSARVRRYRPWGRKAVLLERPAIGCYAAAIPLAGLALVRPWTVIAAGFAGFWCQRSAIFARRLGDDAQEKDDVPGD